jgi:DNA invertase Pin-like site-specific DNA recombinase
VVVVSIARPLKVLSGAVALFIRTDALLALALLVLALLLFALGAVAELERDLIRERVAAGVQAAKRRGARFGRPVALTREMAERVHRLRGGGQSVRAIAQLLGVGVATIHRALANGHPPRSETLPATVAIPGA